LVCSFGVLMDSALANTATVVRIFEVSLFLTEFHLSNMCMRLVSDGKIYFY